MNYAMYQKTEMNRLCEYVDLLEKERSRLRMQNIDIALRVLSLNNENEDLFYALLDMEEQRDFVMNSMTAVCFFFCALIFYLQL